MEIQTLVLVLLFLLISSFTNFSTATECKENTNNPSKSAYTITVDKSGKGNYSTVQTAVNSVPDGNQEWIRIYLQPGIYEEKVGIPWSKECIILEGSGYEQTRITWDGHGQTDTSATFTVNAGNFVAKGIAFENSYDMSLVLHESKDWVPAVAATINGDKSAFHHCAFMGFQDTLWDLQGRHYFNSCYIEGAVDFIWGSGQSFFEDCLINVTAGLLPSQISAGYITAQGKESAEDPSGFVFERGSVFGIGQAYLGRAYGPHSRVVFYGTHLGAVVVPQGWDAWNYQGHEYNFMYVEINCNGAGADTSRRVKWEKTHLDESELEGFSREQFIDQDGWLENQP